VVDVGDGVAFGQDGEVGRENTRPADWIKAKISSAVCGQLGCRWRAYVCALRHVGRQRISLQGL
jgi:hypothetical protein